jgi:Ca-activated chloride channel family protein
MMRSRVFRNCLALLSLCAAAPFGASARQQPVPPAAGEQVFRAHSDLVVLHVNVFDGRSDAVPGLPQEAFSVIEDGRPQTITFFNSADVPVTVGLVLDNSGSMIARQRMVFAGGQAFVDGSHAEDETFSVIFNENVRFALPSSVPFTTNPVLLKSTLTLYPPGGKTALFDAVVAALDHLEDGRHQKRVLIVLSDGEDNASRVSEDDMLDKANRSTAIIYTVSSATAGRADGDGKPRLLRRLADVSGGVAYFPASDREVIESFAEIAGNIRRGYSIGYEPSNPQHDGRFRKVQVRVRAPGHRNLTVRARDGYLASDHAGTR